MADDARAHLIEILKDFNSAMLVTRSADGQLHGRPMGVAEVGDEGELWFCAALDSGKIADIDTAPDVAIMMQGKTKFASISGRARITTDRQQIARLWKNDWKIWFPGGKDDPNLGLIAVTPTEGEWWDNSGWRGLKFAFEAVKAVLQGEHMPDQKEENARVRLAGSRR
ncbi:MAG TPA: pyridoxamine 5'-phosphate oxidase family protein [Nannocystaceae bacterium]|nr:pyridoxamine 5'-phosphate oxidase family protein [Nannocystaceae bacterium]